MDGERISPSIETRNDDSQRSITNLLVPTNNPPCLDHQVEATLHWKISSIEISVDKTIFFSGIGNRSYKLDYRINKRFTTFI